MAENPLSSRVGQRVFLQGHFDTPVILEDVRSLGMDGSAGYECRVRLPDGALEETVISSEEAATISGVEEKPAAQPADAESLRLLIESARIRLAYAYDRQFAVSLSGIRTLPHQIEALNERKRGTHFSNCLNFRRMSLPLVGIVTLQDGIGCTAQLERKCALAFNRRGLALS